MDSTGLASSKTWTALQTSKQSEGHKLKKVKQHKMEKTKCKVTSAASKATKTVSEGTIAYSSQADIMKLTAMPPAQLLETPIRHEMSPIRSRDRDSVHKWSASKATQPPQKLSRLVSLSFAS